MPAFDKLLIANRGEIAVRICRTARAMGLRTVAVHSAADRGAPHVRAADEAVEIGAAPPLESYLSIERIAAAAERTDAHAVHPGYGFLAENADFAEACARAGLIFVGPPADAIRLMGNKRAAKACADEAGVAGIPGFAGVRADDATLAREAERLGTPLFVKAAAGGGGRGLRLVRELAELPVALVQARSEAAHAFDDDELILEKALEAPHHVEVQVLADGHGNVVHLGERDCSIQRRHQKIIEEAPSPVLGEGLRARMGAAAVEVARAAGYQGAGTVEFLLDRDHRFYFLEMNTRLQVEHPVTELVTGLDLVAWQLRIAQGEALAFDQDAVQLRGHAIEARLYAEDPYDRFLPQSGTVAAWAPAAAPGLRIDHAVETGLQVSPHYDPLLAKLVAWGESREVARRRLLRAVEETTLLGLASNKGFLAQVLGHRDFVGSAAATDFIDRAYPDGPEPPALAPATRALAAVLLAEHGVDGFDGWSSTGALAWPLRLGYRGEATMVWIAPRGGGYRVSAGDDANDIAIVGRDRGRVRYIADGVERAAGFAVENGALWLDVDGAVGRFEELGPASAGASAAADGRLTAPMAGRIVAVRTESGAAVEKGECLIVLEAMKMEHEVRSPLAGAVARVAVREGEQVAARQVLIELEAGA